MILRLSKTAVKHIQTLVTIQRISQRKLTGKSVIPRKQPGWRMSTFNEGHYILLIFPCITLYLAYWQNQRRRWKNQLIKDLTSRLNKEPVALPQNLNELSDLEFCPITVEGEFDYSNEVFIGPRSSKAEGPGEMGGQKESGKHVITPFKLADRDLTILINRGWYSMKHFKDEEYRAKGKVPGKMKVTGVVRFNQSSVKVMDLVSDPNKPHVDADGSRTYTYRNVDNLSQVCGTSPVFLDSVADKMWPYAPKGVMPSADLRNTHLEYMFTWGLLSAILLVIWLRKHRTPPNPSVIHEYLTKQDMKREKLKEIQKK